MSFEKELIYLASPYSHEDVNVMASRFDKVCRVASLLMKKGFKIFSPIAHTHPIATRGGLPLDFNFWRDCDLAILRCCKEMWILTIDGWKESKGIKAEVAICRQLQIHIWLVNEQGDIEGSNMLNHDESSRFISRALLNDGQEYQLYQDDCMFRMHEMPSRSIDFSIFSPPFPALYAYSSDPGDIGNSEDLKTETKIHLSFFYRQFARILKPGRVAIIHVAQIPRMKRSGGKGLFDFRGLNIRLGERAGLVFEYDWTVRKNPQAQAIRTKSRELQFSGLEADRAQSRGCLPDYLLKFRAPGQNETPIESKGQVSRNEWIEWAECTWSDISETDTLNVREAKGEDDTKHICVSRGSLVLTDRGYVPIQDVQIGDFTLTHMGRWRPVLAKECIGIRSIVQVEAQGVPYLHVTPDHKLWTRTSTGKGRWPGQQGGTSDHRATAKKSIPEWMPAVDTKAHYVNLKLPPVEESEYSTKEWWLVGRWLGDGHYDARGGLHISCSHKEARELVNALGEHAGFINTIPPATQIRVKDRKGRLRQLLAKFGRGALGKKLPREAICLDPLKARALLSGYLSADGHYVARYRRWSATSISRPLLLGMAMVAQRARGVVCSVYAGRHGGQYVIDGRTVNTHNEWILSVPPQNVSGMILEDGAWKKVRQIRQEGEEEVWNLRVEEDASFTVEGCIVKNCPLQLPVINRCIRLYTNPGEIVFSPFAGIGSEGYMALKLERRFVGVELKSEYHQAALRNLEQAIDARNAESKSLFV